MAHVYRTKFFRIGIGKLFKIVGTTGNGTLLTGPYPRLNDRNYVTSSGTITRVTDQNTKVTQYP